MPNNLEQANKFNPVFWNKRPLTETSLVGVYLQTIIIFSHLQNDNLFLIQTIKNCRLSVLFIY